MLPGDVCARSLAPSGTSSTGLESDHKVTDRPYKRLKTEEILGAQSSIGGSKPPQEASMNATSAARCAINVHSAAENLPDVWQGLQTPCTGVAIGGATI
jgi:hypothetical protein